MIMEGDKMSNIINFGDYNKPSTGSKISVAEQPIEMSDTDIDTILVRADITDEEWNKIIASYEDSGYYNNNPIVNVIPDGLFTDNVMCIATVINGDMILIKRDGSRLEWKGDK